MDRRFKILAEAKKRDIIIYNKSFPKNPMPYIVIIIDELADLMAVAAREIEAAIVRLAQMARATGIHLVVATQRPSVDVITGLIKANIIARIAFAVASQTDSRTILDTSGAEKLLGKGDMLFQAPDVAKPRRIQGAFISEKEIKNVTDFLKERGTPAYNEEILTPSGPTDLFGDLPEDELYEEAKQVVIAAGRASASLLQRRLKVGYARAARLLDLLEENGVVGPVDGAKPRKVLIKAEDIESAGDEEDEDYQEEESFYE
jgi:S-DNA-T family DNA segregation ATPase FtsK/SpoIIIE